MSDDYRDLLRSAALDPESFVRAAFSGQQPGPPLDWIRVTLRVIAIKNVKHLQFAYYDAKKCITKNYVGADIVGPLNALLALPFKSLHLTTVQEEIQISFPKSGPPRMHRTWSIAQQSPSNLPTIVRKICSCPKASQIPICRPSGL